MFSTSKLKTKALRIIVALITISVVILAAAGANVMVRETKTYSAVNYNLQYDDSKLSVGDDDNKGSCSLSEVIGDEDIFEFSIRILTCVLEIINIVHSFSYGLS